MIWICKIITNRTHWTIIIIHGINQRYENMKSYHLNLKDLCVVLTGPNIFPFQCLISSPTVLASTTACPFAYVIILVSILLTKWTQICPLFVFVCTYGLYSLYELFQLFHYSPIIHFFELNNLFNIKLYYQFI